MNNQDLEKQIRMLRPAPLPDELQTRLEPEPLVTNQQPKRHVVKWAIAASLVAAATLAVVLIPPGNENPVAANDGHLSIMRQESTLVSTRTLETREHNGQLWDLVENKWREDTISMCSATPATVRSTEIRPELVWVPVKFY